MLYDCLQDARMRLEGSIIRFKREPVYVLQCDEGVDEDDEKIIILSLEECITKKRINVRLEHPGIDVASPPLGYVSVTTDSGTSVAYATRSPERKQAQGLHPNRIVLFANGTRQCIRNILVTLQDIGKCIVNDYSNANSLYEELMNGNISPYRHIAFSRELAASTDKLFYMAHKIGDIRHSDKEHIVTITISKFEKYTFEGVFNENWRIDR